MNREGISLVVGADGFIGRALVDHLTHMGEFVSGTTRRRDILSERRIFLDLAEPEYIPGPISVAYFCAAVSSLEACQKNPFHSAKINVQHTVALVKQFVSQDTFVIFPSTNLVYDGSVPFQKSETPTSPRTEYGRQKAQVEKQLLALGESVSIVRFTKVVGPNMPLFQGWIQALEKKEVIHPFSDKVMAPIPLLFTVTVLYRIAQARLPGIVQVSGEKDVTYSQVAYYIAQRMGADFGLVQSISSKEANPGSETDPLHTTLDTTRLRTKFGIEPPGVWSTIDTMLGL